MESSNTLDKNKKIVDARGELCPKPLIMTKKALKDFTGELRIILDNETAFENVKKFLKDNKKELSGHREDSLYIIELNSDGAAADITEAENYCTISKVKDSKTEKNSSYIIVFDKNQMGRGDNELGEILLQGFCNTIGEMEKLPSSVIFYNSGVLLTKESSPVLPALKELEKKGVEILVCGTCTDYYSIKEKIKAGRISNMYDIMECLISAEKIIKP